MVRQPAASGLARCTKLGSKESRQPAESLHTRKTSTGRRACMPGKTSTSKGAGMLGKTGTGRRACTLGNTGISRKAGTAGMTDTNNLA